MQLKTTEPVVWQVLLATLGSLLAAALGALADRARRRSGRVGGADVAHTCRSRGACRRGRPAPPPRSSSRERALWAGAPSLPKRRIWPSLAFESAALPWVAAALAGLATVASIAVGLFLLYILDRVTAAWTRRSWLAAGFVIAVIAGLVAVKAGDAGVALAEGIAVRARRRGGDLLRAALRSAHGAGLRRDRDADRRRGKRGAERDVGGVDSVRGHGGGEHRRRVRGDALFEPAAGYVRPFGAESLRSMHGGVPRVRSSAASTTLAWAFSWPAR